MVSEPMLAAVAFAATAALTPAAAALANRVGLVDRAAGEGLKIHEVDIPIAGGASIFVAVGVVSTIDRGGWDAALLLTMGLTGLVGLVDDVRPLRAWLRVALLAGSGGVVALALPGPQTLISVAWVGFQVTAVCNAVNIIDGQDALAAGLAAIAALGFTLLGSESLGFSTAVLAGALIGFLVWNRPPARCFLGNSGAYAVGGALALLAARYQMGQGARGLLVSGACLGVFLFELGSTAARRALSAPTLSGGDRQHSYDRLAAHLDSRPASTAVIWAAGAVCAGLALAMTRAPVWMDLTIAIVAGVATVAFGAWQGLRTRNRVKA